jgi:hypothetical protein
MVITATLYEADANPTNTYSWSLALLEKLPVMQLLKNFPAFCGT